MGDGTSLEIIPNIRGLYKDLRIAIFTMLPSVMLRKAMKEYGIEYVINKAVLPEDSTRMLSLFLKNEPPPTINVGTDTENPFADLTSREIEILHYLLKGDSTSAIAKQLNVTAQTISTLKSRILERTGATNIKELETLAAGFQIFA